MTEPNKTSIVHERDVGWDAFGDLTKQLDSVDTPQELFFKFKEGIEYRLGFDSARVDMKEFAQDGKGVKPMLVLAIDYWNGNRPERKYVWCTGSKEIVAKAYWFKRRNLLFNSVFRVSATKIETEDGSKSWTQYAFDFDKPKPQKRQ